MITRKDVAEYAGVSTGTVSNIINGKKSVDTTKTINAKPKTVANG